MERKRTAKACKKCREPFMPYRSTDAFCSFACAKAYSQERTTSGKPRPRKRIKRISNKHGSRVRKYTRQRRNFLSLPGMAKCFIPGCDKKATTIEHTKGREGYADDYARDNDIWLLNDERYFKPCCLKHNLQLENNPELARQHKVSRIHGGAIDEKQRTK